MPTRIHATASLLALATLALPLARPLVTERPGEPGPGAGVRDDDPEGPLATLAAMDWLAGDWSGPMWGGDFHAFYSTPEGGLILSHSRLLKEGRETFYEFEVFGPMDDETVWLQPFPGGKKAVGFRLKDLDHEARKATFEQPEKDYPTRIVYHRTAEDALVITLSDPHGDSDKTETFNLRLQ